jgi:uncharacterized membrane protein
MAHESLPVTFWVWNQTGPYFGMPVQNFAGWAGTALLFMGLSRWLWGIDVGPREVTLWVPLGIYVANTAFAAVLSASVGLWVPILLSAVLGLAPLLLVRRPSVPGRGRGPGGEGEQTRWRGLWRGGGEPGAGAPASSTG